MITLLYFAGLKDKTGIEKEQLSFAGKSVEDLLKYVQQKYEGFTNGVVHVAINEEFARKEDVLNDGDTVAFIPPVSGG